MKSFKMISSQTGACGYIEDDWQIIENISNEKELYEALKEGYLKDAMNRNDYPIVSFPIDRIYTRDKLHIGYGGCEQIDYDDENQIDYRSKDSDIDLEKEINVKYRETFEKFEKWQKKIKSLLPILRELKRKKDKKEYEIKKLSQLAEKYGYELIKKEEYILADIYLSRHNSNEEIIEKVIITKEDEKLIKASTISLDIETGLTKNDINISKINKSIKDYLDSDGELENNFWIKRFINLSNDNTKEYKIDKKEKELEEAYNKRTKVNNELFTLNNLDKKFRKGIDMKELNKGKDIIEIAINRIKREIGELRNV